MAGDTLSVPSNFNRNAQISRERPSIWSLEPKNFQ